jgi:hypothetical protein
LEEKWGAKYRAMIRLWRNAWTEFIPFLDYVSLSQNASNVSGCWRCRPALLTVFGVWAGCQAAVAR